MKSGLSNQLSVRLDQASYKVIQTSGQKPADWLRQAVAWRIENERQAVSALTALENRISELEQRIIENQQGILKLQQSEAITQATLAEVQKGLGIVQKNQGVLHEMLIDLSQSMRQQFQSLGMSLLTELSQQLQDMAKIEEEPSAFKMKPVPPRTRL